MFCRECGHPLRDTAQICPKCGTKVRDTTQVEASKEQEVTVVAEKKKVQGFAPIEEEVVENKKAESFAPIKEEEKVAEVVEKKKIEVFEPTKKEEKVVAENEKEESLAPIEEEEKVEEEKVVAEQEKEESLASIEEETDVNLEKTSATKSFDWNKYKGMILGVAGVFIILVIAIVVSSLLKGNNGEEETQANAEIQITKEEENQKTALAEQKKEENVESAEEDISSILYTMLNNQEYETVISEITNRNMDELSDKDAYMLNSMLEEAIEGQLTNACQKIDALASEGSFDEAFAALEQEKIYREGLIEKAIIDNQVLTDKYEELLQNYSQYVANRANHCAAVGDEEGMKAIFAQSDSRLSGGSYEQVKKNAYTTLILARLSQMYEPASQTFTNGYDAESAMTYIEENQSKAGNSCIILENWDYFFVLYRIENGVPNWEITVDDVSSSGYILDYSNSQELTVDDISHLSRHELYLARMEIYARHGRGFMDSTVQQHFSKYGWYQSQIDPANFDESSLSELEVKNRDFILQYEEQLGYRNCR